MYLILGFIVAPLGIIKNTLIFGRSTSSIIDILVKHNGKLLSSDASLILSNIVKLPFVNFICLNEYFAK